MSETQHRYYPFQTLIEQVKPDSLQQLASSIGYTPRSLHRWKKAGVIPERSADQLAINIGLHPANIWPVEYQRFASPE